MADQSHFIWHADARLFAGTTAISRASKGAVPAFRTIPASPTAVCLCQLGQQILAGKSFCVSDSERDTAPDVPPSHFLTLSGGSSGRPKAIRRSQLSWIQSFETNAELFDIAPQDSLGVLGKLSHSLALYGVLEGLHLGCGVYALDALTPKGQFNKCLHHRVRILYATPTQLKRLTVAAKGRVLPDLRLLLCGGGSLDTPTRTAIEALAPNASLHVFYGAAETSFITLSTAATPVGSVGRPYPGVSVKILDETGKPTSEIGEVWVQSPYLFDHYEQGNSLDTYWRDGFLTVGEMGIIDNDGWLWLSGRRTRMVTIADQNVYPETVEGFISDLPGVAACTVLARIDRLRGHRLIALLEGAADDDLADTVQRACRNEFGALVAPKEIKFMSSLPRLASGKIDFAALAADLEGLA